MLHGELCAGQKTSSDEVVARVIKIETEALLDRGCGNQTHRRT